jgi:Domain of unknown function (DUF4193)
MADEEHTNDVDLDDGEDFEEVPEEIDEDLVADDADEEDVVDADVDDFDSDDDLVADDADEEEETPKTARPARTRRGDDEEEDDDDEEVADDDVEADLDTILKDRIAAQPDDEEEDEEEGQPEPDDRGDGAGRIQPRRPGEFVCQSCFLVKHPSQLADPDAMLCTDCV